MNVKGRILVYILYNCRKFYSSWCCRWLLVLFRFIYSVCNFKYNPFMVILKIPFKSSGCMLYCILYKKMICDSWFGHLTMMIIFPGQTIDSIKWYTCHLPLLFQTISYNNVHFCIICYWILTPLIYCHYWFKVISQIHIKRIARIIIGHWRQLQ